MENHDSTSGIAIECFEHILSELSTPLAHKASCLLKTGGLQAVLGLKVDPGQYTCPKTLLSDLTVVSFFKKYENFSFSSA